MSFTDYEKYHLHDYVDKKGSSYTKQEVDNKVASLKSEITTLIQSSIQTALNKFSSDIQNSSYDSIPKSASQKSCRSKGSRNTED